MAIRSWWRSAALRAALFLCASTPIRSAEPAVAGVVGTDLPASLRAVLENTRPLEHPRAGRLPLWVLPISHALAGVDDARAEWVLRELDRRGIGYTVAWDPASAGASAAEAVRIGRIQARLGLEIAADATRCLQFFDGTEATLHEDDGGVRFAETSFGGKLGCPFALAHRMAPVGGNIDAFVARYRQAGLSPRLVLADWEVDGPIEWNDAWATSQRCRRCRAAVPGIGDFRRFQKAVRDLRSRMQRDAYADRLTAAFPGVLVGNYGVYPHDGYRYWYDYFERDVEGDGMQVPFRADQRARYREWAHEFPGTGYTFAMPVVYTWYRLFDWYDFAEPDYRWFYNLLLTGSNPGQHTPASVPLITFVHWNTTAPPGKPDPRVVPFSEARYQDVLWHLLLRGHDTFFLWCLPEELPKEIALVQAVYAAALEHRDFLDRGEPVSFEVPGKPGPVVSGLRLGDRVLVRRTDFDASSRGRPVGLALSGGGRILVPPEEGGRILPVDPPASRAGLLRSALGWRFPIGFYELPRSGEGLREMAAAGVNLVRCGGRGDLDRAGAVGMMGWVPLPVQEGATPALEALVSTVADHPALAAWEGPDEVVWNFTAYSGLERSAGFGRSEWRSQAPKAVAHAAGAAAQLLPRLRAGVGRVRELDTRGLPFWINEAADSDAGYVRASLEGVDVTGCDYYPVRSTGSDVAGVGRLVERWRAVGEGRPVWMVLQAFSWHGLRPDRGRRYPTFLESRFMAYDAIVRGARGILYWGSERIDDPAFRGSIYALTSELAALEPALTGDGGGEVRVRMVEEVQEAPGLGVRAMLLRSGNEFALILVNEDPVIRTGVDVSGLAGLEGRALSLLHGEEPVRVRRGAVFTRLQAHEVKVFVTERGWQSPGGAGRRYGLE